MTTTDAPAFGPSALLEELKARQENEPPAAPLGDRLPVSRITRHPELFQPREMDQRHIQELRRATRNVGNLEAVTVLQIGPEAILVDGHHRCDAYEDEGVTRPVPIRVFQGTVEEAVLEAGRANSKAKLPMTTAARMDYAWRLTLMGYSKKQTMEASAASEGQVAIMRRVKRALHEAGVDPYQIERWEMARLELKRMGEPSRTIDDRAEWIEAQAGKFADRLAQEFGTKLSRNVEVAARTLEFYFGRQLPAVLSELWEYREDADREGELDF